MLDGLVILSSPAILFFLLGFAAGWVKSDLQIPEPLSKGLSLYLLVAIGLKGGAAIAASGAGGAGLIQALLVGIAISAVLPVVAYPILRSATDVDRSTAAAVAGHYGSVSVVTFVAALEAVKAVGLAPEPYLPAVMAVMEAPGIVVALLLARRHSAAESSGPVLRAVLLHGSVVVLIGSLLIGKIIGPQGFEPLKPFVEGLFPGLICLFLLDMGLLAAHRLREGRRLTARLVGFGIVMPLIGAAFGLGGAMLLGLGVAGTAVLATLGASASYIAAPAAMRGALPEADQGVYVPLSIGVTFPFNVVIGVPIYLAIAQAIAAP